MLSTILRHTGQMDTSVPLVLELSVYKYLDTSQVDLDVQPQYVRATIKEKVFQLCLPEEISPDASKAERSKITGHLVVTMPKVNQVCGRRAAEWACPCGRVHPRRAHALLTERRRYLTTTTACVCFTVAFACHRHQLDTMRFLQVHSKTCTDTLGFSVVSFGLHPQEIVPARGQQQQRQVVRSGGGGADMPRSARDGGTGRELLEVDDSARPVRSLHHVFVCDSGLVPRGMHPCFVSALRQISAYRNVALQLSHTMGCCRVIQVEGNMCQQALVHSL